MNRTLAVFSFAPTRLGRSPRLPRTRARGLYSGAASRLTASLKRCPDTNPDFSCFLLASASEFLELRRSAGKRYTPGRVIFWNHGVGGRTGMKSLERNELQAKSRKAKT